MRSIGSRVELGSCEQGDWKLQGRRSGVTKSGSLISPMIQPKQSQPGRSADRTKLKELQALLDRHQAGSRELLWHPNHRNGPTAVDKTRAQRVEPGDEVVYWPN